MNLFLQKVIQKFKLYWTDICNHYVTTTNSIYYALCYHNDFIRLNCWVEQRYGKLTPRNYGDELNIFLTEELTGKKAVSIHSIRPSTKTNYMVIGSILDSNMITPNSVIWGSGTMWGDNRPLVAMPKQILATRGKLTQQYLRNQGIESPNIYGDPALLMPLIYNPEVKKRYRIGLIPHVFDIDCEPVRHLQTLDPDIQLISFENYNDWHNIIRQIKSCDYILSSSLHGLILSDAYQIPNAWVRFSDKIHGGNYKFLDYFSGVNRSTRHPLVVNLQTTIDHINDVLNQYEPIEYDSKQLLKACPFKIKNF